MSDRLHAELFDGCPPLIALERMEKVREGAGMRMGKAKVAKRLTESLVLRILPSRHFA